MNAIKLISEPKKRLFELLLKDARINQIVLTNDETPEYIRVNDDGSVTFGRTKKHWWNVFFKDYVTKDFEMVCIRMLKAFSKYLPPDSYLTQLLSQEIIENAIKHNNYEDVIDRFVMYAFLGVTEGDYVLNKLKLKNDKPQQQQQNARGKPNDCSKNNRVRCLGTAFLDLGGDCSIPVNVVVDL